MTRGKLAQLFVAKRQNLELCEISKAINTLEHLVDMGIPVVCDKWLTLPPSPDVIDVDVLYDAASSLKKLDAAAIGSSGG